MDSFTQKLYDKTEHKHTRGSRRESESRDARDCETPRPVESDRETGDPAASARRRAGRDHAMAARPEARERRGPSVN